ncbi:MAG: hypothetical protein H8D23_30655 [Candidatus Brocadiales bacterium]|nr:hypothetical protein [Candidatus Brocadiales bacterium]
MTTCLACRHAMTTMTTTTTTTTMTTNTPPMIELQEKNEHSRPQLLRVLCILTFIGSGLSLLSNFIMFMSIDIVRKYYENGMFDFLGEEMDLSVLELFLSTNSTYFMLMSMLFALGIYGAYLMWNLKQIGFHFYTLAQIVLLILPQVFIPALPFPTFELIISLIFVVLYAKNLKIMS